MTMRMEFRWAVFLAFALPLLLVGCTQPAITERCSGFGNPADKEACTNRFAIWYQDPYSCYGITNASLRETCLEGSNNVETQRQLIESQNIGVRNPVAPATPTPSPAGLGDQNVSVGMPPSNLTGSADERVEKCRRTENLGADECRRRVAIDNADMSLCGLIDAGDLRNVCIAHVSLGLKNPKACETLTRSEDVNLCKYYSSG